MSVRQTDNPSSRRLTKATRALIVCKDEHPMTPQLRDHVIEWMQESPENVRELLAMEKFANELARLNLVDRAAQLAETPARATFPLINRRVALLGSGAAALAFSVGWWKWTTGDDDLIRHVTLPDGSVMHVLRDSEYEIDFSAAVRLINMPRGEAVFEVAKNSARSFLVRSQWSDSIAIGTRFGVVTDTAATITTVSEGVVRVVTPANSDPSKGVTLRAGEEIRVAASTARPRSAVAVNAERKMLWATGWLEFEGEKVSDAVTAFNRFNRVRIQITQPKLADLRLPYFRVEVQRPDSFANSLGRALEAPVTWDPSGRVVYVGEDPPRR